MDDLGEFRLRDLSQPQRLFQVKAPGLKDSFPPLRTLDLLPGNLPAQATSFLGRDSDLGEVRRLLRESRLVTLTGVGGVGNLTANVKGTSALLPTQPLGFTSALAKRQIQLGMRATF